MQKTSEAYNRQIYESGRRFYTKIIVDFADGTSLILNDDDVLLSGLSIEEATSSSSDFELGAAVIGELTLKLDNLNGRFDAVDFLGAALTARVGLLTEQKPNPKENTIEYIQKGIYIVDEATKEDRTVTLRALDKMSLFDRPYSESGLRYPATLLEIVRDCCTHCGVTLYSSDFYNRDYSVPVRPDDKSLTFREVISYAAQLAGSYAKMNPDGKLLFGWYQSDPPVLEIPDVTDMALEDYEITGVTILETRKNEDGNDEELLHQYGTDKNVFAIEKNPLAQQGLTALCEALGGRLAGLRFRPFSSKWIGNPAIEAGDAVTVLDNKGQAHLSFLTTLSYQIDEYETYSCKAKTAQEKGTTRYTEAAKAQAAARKESESLISSYDIAIKEFAAMTANSLGYYQTQQMQDDGSLITYQHDKPSLADSAVIWKKSRDTFSVSDDGGKTWRGLDKEGNAVIKVLSAEGINADWIKTGKITASNNNNVYFDLNQGELSASKLTSSDTRAPDVNVKLGMVDWWGGGQTKGLNINTGSGLFGRLHYIESEDTTGGLGIVSNGPITIRGNAQHSSDDNSLKLFNDTNNEGNIQLWRARGNKKDTLALSVTPDELRLVQDFSNDYSNSGRLYFTTDEAYIGRFYSSTNQSSIWMENGNLDFAVGNYVQMSIQKNRTDINHSLYVNGVSVTSDPKYKTNITPSDIEALDKVKKLKFYSYHLLVPSEKVRMATATGLKDEKSVEGSSPQKAPVLVPSQKRTDIGILYDEAPNEIKTGEEDERRSIDLYAYTSLLAKAVQELSAQVDALKQQLSNLENKAGDLS